MRINKCHFVHLFFIAAALSACGSSPEEIHKGMLESQDMDQFQRFVGKAQRLGGDAIPIYVDVLDKSLDEPAKLLNYGKTGTCIQKLHELALEGVFELQEIPVLLRAMDLQLAIEDTLPTAYTLQIITGVDVGYDSSFVLSYKVDDEERRQEMISAWRHWYATKSSEGQ